MVELTLYVMDAAITVVAENGTLNPITIVRTKIVVIILLNKFFMSTSLYLSYGFYHITNLFFVYPINLNFSNNSIIRSYSSCSISVYFTLNIAYNSIGLTYSPVTPDISISFSI